MYSLFHDLTHNSLFESRAANAGWGHALGYLLFTPYRWWQRQHSLHHAHAGNLDHRGVGEIYTMTVAEYERPRSRAGWATAPIATRCSCCSSARASCSCSNAASPSGSLVAFRALGDSDMAPAPSPG